MPNGPSRGRLLAAWEASAAVAEAGRDYRWRTAQALQCSCTPGLIRRQFKRCLDRASDSEQVFYLLILQRGAPAPPTEVICEAGIAQSSGAKAIAG